LRQVASVSRERRVERHIDDYVLTEAGFGADLGAETRRHQVVVFPAMTLALRGQ
jgi:formyltetrahydrofolate synthetase